MQDDYILQIKHLKVDLISVQGVVHAVRDINMNIRRKGIHGIVGESGCGKSMTAGSILRLHNEKRTFYQGSIQYFRDNQEPIDILRLKQKYMVSLRGKEIAMIFQDPITTMNPLYSVGEQISETLRQHEHLSRNEAREKGMNLLETVNIRPAEIRYKQYPYEYSGGMLQRAVIAMAISCNPRLLIADEPTTALDVTSQAQILDLLVHLRDEMGMSIVVITHNFGVVAEICDDVSVMYAGQIVESGKVRDIFHYPRHPYTKDLIASIPKSSTGQKRLVTIPGFPPKLNQVIEGCAYAPRCRYASEVCYTKLPDIQSEGSHQFACHLQTER